eukprot:352084-Chlamydomonas_euryale.AAC.2
MSGNVRRESGGRMSGWRERGHVRRESGGTCQEGVREHGVAQFSIFWGWAQRSEWRSKARIACGVTPYSSRDGGTAHWRWRHTAAPRHVNNWVSITKNMRMALRADARCTPV